MSTKVNGETRERLGQSAKWSAAVRGQAGRGATVAGRRRPGAAEQNVGIFCLPGFVADRWPICFSSGSLPRFFPHVRDPREGVAMEERNFQCATEFGKHQRQGDEDDDDEDEEQSLSHTKKRKRAIYMLQEVVDFAMTTEEGGGGAANKHHVYGFRAFHSVSTMSPLLE